MIRWLIVGLGNPGEAYQQHRHNVGFLLLEQLVQTYDFNPWKKQHQGIGATGTIQDYPVIALKPYTMMNLSGTSLQQAHRFYKISHEHIIVLHDDVDLTPGTVKFKKGGGHGGHNGLRHISQCIGSGYNRIRIGVGRPSCNTMSTAQYVLSSFSQEEQRLWLTTMQEVCVKAFPLLLSQNHDRFISQLALVKPRLSEPE